jgi:hypothetical protein
LFVASIVPLYHFSFRRTPSLKNSKNNTDNVIVIIKPQQIKLTTPSSSSSLSPPPSSLSSSLLLEEVVAAPPTGPEEDEDDFDQALRAFTTLLHDDPEQYALRPWTWTKPQQSPSSSAASSSSIHFDGLSMPLLQDALGNKRILLLGDSTSFYLQLWLQRLLLKTSPYTVNALQSLNLTLANQLVYDKYDMNKFLACNMSNLEFMSMATTTAPQANNNNKNNITTACSKKRQRQHQNHLI